MNYRNWLTRTLQVTGLLFISLFCLAVNTPTTHATIALAPCESTAPAVVQPNPNLLQYFASWTVILNTAAPDCAYKGTGEFLPFNSPLVNALSGSTVSSFLCGAGFAHQYIDYSDTTYYSQHGSYPVYSYGNGFCLNGWKVMHSNGYTVTDVATGKVLAPGQHVPQGEVLQVTLNPYPNGNSSTNPVTWTASSTGEYINVAQDSYFNNYPDNSSLDDQYWGKYAHCPGSGSAPACQGVDTILGGEIGAPFDFYSATSLTGAAALQNIADNTQGYTFSLSLGSGWQTISSSRNSWQVQATSSGTLHFSILDNGSYVVPYCVAAACGSVRPDFNADVLLSTTVANVNIPVDSAPPTNSPPNTPVLTCPASPLATFTPGTSRFSSTDPNGDQVRYDVDTDYNGSTFNPTTSVPVSGYVASAAQQTTTSSYATVGTHTIAVRAEDSHNAYSGIATCTVTVSSGSTGTTPNLQFAVNSSGLSYTDQTVYYSMPQDAWGSSGAGLTVPSRFLGSSTYQACVVMPYPAGSRGTNPVSGITSSWDSWPTLGSPSSYTSTTPALHLTGTSATPSVGSTYTLQFQFGCGTAAQVASGTFQGSGDVQTVVIQITSPTNGSFVDLKVAQGGNTPVDAPINNPYLYPATLAASGNVLASGMKLSWTSANVTSCTFTRSDLATPQGTILNSIWGWNNTQSTSSIFSGSDSADVSFASTEALPSYTFAFQITCATSTGNVTSSAYVQYKRSTFVGSSTTIKGTVFNDAGGVLGVQDGSEAGIANQQLTLTLRDVTGAVTTSTTTTDSNGKYSFTFTPTAAQGQGGTYTLAVTTPPASGWQFTYPASGSYSNYLLSNGATITDNFGERSGQGAYTSVTGKVYKDVNNNGVLDANEVGIPNITMQLQVTYSFLSGPCTAIPYSVTMGTPQTKNIVTNAIFKNRLALVASCTEAQTLVSTVTDANGNYTLTAYVHALPSGAYGATYTVTEVTPLQPGWLYSQPVGGTFNFAGTLNTVTTENFGNVPPVTYNGTVYYDANLSGSSSGQTPIAGDTVQAYDTTTGAVASVYNLSSSNPTPNTPVTSVTSAADGTYSIAIPYTLYGHGIEMREKPAGTYANCTNPGQVTGGYCQYSPADTLTTQFGQTLTRDFGNSDKSGQLTVLSGKITNVSTGSGIANVTVGIYDASNLSVPLYTTVSPTLSDGQYSFSIAYNSAQYTSLLGRQIVVKQVPASITGYTVSTPSTSTNGYTFAFDGTSGTYNFADLSSSGGAGFTPPNPSNSYFCDQD